MPEKHGAENESHPAHNVWAEIKAMALDFASKAVANEVVKGLGESSQTYKGTDNIPSFDKGGHAARSLANAPEHGKHWGSKAESVATGKHNVTGHKGEVAGGIGSGSISGAGSGVNGGEDISDYIHTK